MFFNLLNYYSMGRIFLISAVVLTLLMEVGCSSKDKKEVDANDPEISITFPAEDQKFISGGNNYIQFSGEVNDDLALNELAVTLEWHGETKSTGIDGDGTVTSVFDPWETQTEILVLTGKSQTFSQTNLFDSPIPDNIQGGFYVLTFVLSDKAGKSVTLSRTVEIL